MGGGRALGLVQRVACHLCLFVDEVWNDGNGAGSRLVGRANSHLHTIRHSSQGSGGCPFLHRLFERVETRCSILGLPAPLTDHPGSRGTSLVRSNSVVSSMLLQLGTRRCFG